MSELTLRAFQRDLGSCLDRGDVGCVFRIRSARYWREGSSENIVVRKQPSKSSQTLRNLARSYHFASRNFRPAASAVLPVVRVTHVPSPVDRPRAPSTLMFSRIAHRRAIALTHGGRPTQIHGLHGHKVSHSNIRLHATRMFAFNILLTLYDTIGICLRCSPRNGHVWRSTSPPSSPVDRNVQLRIHPQTLFRLPVKPSVSRVLLSAVFPQYHYSKLQLPDLLSHGG
ncbi:hypothetical protein OF83DRAFT_358051 [Amylostereum chailletii]|nr:hypothetical protein OF83DRAFT_358051 [Amylostereum chailletii]